MTNQCLNKKFILLITLRKFISLSRFFLVKEKMISFLCFLIINGYFKIASKRIRIVFLLFEKAMKNIYFELSQCFYVSVFLSSILFFYNELLILEI
jgi:hypothetical protein